MKTKLGNIFAVLSMAALLGSMSSLTIAAEPIDTEIRAAIQKVTTPSDHEAVAKYYENAAMQMQAKVQEEKELLEQYENKSYLYGRQAQDLQSHTAALIHRHEQTVVADMKEAALHRRMASKLDENHAASDRESPAM
ncbi:hypothetical protein SAMN05216412_103223 [Nitrosospira multiformis]|uniref:DUF4398 domain-containing protein n=2 Tax=Nitrosospira multiformis TaxID=1231 RepID=A0A1I0C1E4_9PROT|nr:hypothetical protein [Nitrosospira multiformis]SET12901.1 hypothetical protein SAMN05216412_103223 [Nitrosospira multiformis]